MEISCRSVKLASAWIYETGRTAFCEECGNVCPHVEEIHPSRKIRVLALFPFPQQTCLICHSPYHIDKALIRQTVEKQSAHWRCLCPNVHSCGCCSPPPHHPARAKQPHLVLLTSKTSPSCAPCHKAHPVHISELSSTVGSH
jgi:hypothetical protein